MSDNVVMSAHMLDQMIDDIKETFASHPSEEIPLKHEFKSIFDGLKANELIECFIIQSFKLHSKSLHLN